ncbi:MAG TPA: DUF190 domain-containing protein [Pirellulales bacterium]|nr:DUF190 domain-containing protein [Pirellulales bacterium]
MKLQGEQLLLRVLLRSTDKYGWQTAAEAVVERAKTAGLNGATLLRATCGLDVTGELLCPGRWSLVERVPVIVEIIDSAARIGPFLTTLRDIVPEGLVTLERAHVLLYRENTTGAEIARQHLQLPGTVADLSTVPTAEDLPIMKLSEDGQLLRVFIGESDTWQGQPLFRAIVAKAHELGLAGATVLHGTMGFGAANRIHSSRVLDVSTDLPIVVEVVDTADKLQTLLPFLDETVQEGMITIESVRILKYRAEPAS